MREQDDDEREFDIRWADGAQYKEPSARARMLRNVGVVARVAPEQKLQVVESLRDAGRVVAMVGDGANDAAAIRAADVGVGINAPGSAAARRWSRPCTSGAATIWCGS